MRKKLNLTQRFPLTMALAGLLALPAVSLADVRVTHADAIRNATKHPTPEYAPMAKQMHIQGEVEVEVKITEDGSVDAVKVVTGNPLLTASVVRAVKDWKFTPFQDGGKATVAVANLKFNFKQ
ncbi:MAG: energy transducer TonB [Bryobacteraceae bacterium]|nr:energy transducer TonB [Bryobacteraceae bacterium]